MPRPAATSSPTITSPPPENVSKPGTRGSVPTAARKLAAATTHSSEPRCLSQWTLVSSANAAPVHASVQARQSALLARARRILDLLRADAAGAVALLRSVREARREFVDVEGQLDHQLAQLHPDGALRVPAQPADARRAARIVK